MNTHQEQWYLTSSFPSSMPWSTPRSSELSDRLIGLILGDRMFQREGIMSEMIHFLRWHSLIVGTWAVSFLLDLIERT